MTLSVCLITKDSAAYVEPLLAGARAYADELVVAVDNSSTDSTLALCRRYADKLFRIEWLPSAASCEWALEWLNEQCGGDWILRLDDDELPSEGLVRALPELMADRTYTHYWIPRRWLVRRDPLEWIAQAPWWPDPQPRLFRNIRSLVAVPGRLHTSYVIQGAGRHVPEGCIYHYDLVMHTADQIRRKVERYDGLSRGEGLGQLYVIPDVQALVTCQAESIDPPSSDTVARQGWKPWSALRKRAEIVTRPPEAPLIPATEIVRDGMSVLRASPEARGAGFGSEMPSQSLALEEVCEAALTSIYCPETMTIGNIYLADLLVENRGSGLWYAFGTRPDDVRVSYHWLRPEGTMAVWDGVRTTVHRAMAPGESLLVRAGVTTPTEPGQYLLQFDLVMEDAAWFSSHGGSGPCVPVEVRR